MIILISGASRGIGRATALTLAAKGHSLVLLSRSTGTLNDLVREITFHGGAATAFQCDVTSSQEVTTVHEKVVKEFSGIDVLINNAGVAPSLKLENTTDELWQNTFAVNVNSAFYLTRTFLPELKQSTSAHIINIASTAALEGYAYTAAYVASKHALLGFARATAKELAKNKISVTTICPGFVRTAILDESIRNIIQKTGKTAAEAEAELGAMNKDGKIIEPDEVAAEVLRSLSLPFDPNGYEIII